MPMARNRCLIVLTNLLLAGTSLAQVQTASSTEGDKPLKQLSLQELSQIEVTTTSKKPVAANVTPAAMYVITAEDIRRSGVTSIPEALRLAPGVEVARIDSDKWSIGIRGFGSRLSRSVLVLIDGRTVYTTLLAGTYWEVQDTVLEDIDRIEVIRGPGGTIWGPNSINGVINIITKIASETHGTIASVGGGSVDQGIATFRYGGGKGPGFDYRVYGKWFTRGPEFHPDRRNFDDWRSGQGGFRTDWTRNTRDHFTVQGDLYVMRAGESVVATSYTPPFSRLLDDNARLSGGNVLGRWSRSLGEDSDVQIQAYYDRANRREPNFEDLRDTYDLDYTQHMRVKTRQNLTWGAGLRWSHGNDIEVVSGLTFSPASRTDSLFTGFVQDEIALVKQRLSLKLGTKLLHTNFSSFEAEPSVRLMWTPTNKSSMWAAFTHAVRTPSDAEHDLFLSGFVGTAPDGKPFFARFNANRHFRPEQLNGYELGFRQLIVKSLYLDVASFFSHYHDLFSEDITGAPFLESRPAPPHLLLPAQFGNGLLGQTKGIELAPEWRPMNWWRLRGSYSFLHMNLEKSPNSLDIGTAPQIMGSSPEHQLSVQSSFDMTKVVDLDFGYRYVSALPGQLVPSYSTADARLGWTFHPGFELSLVGRNLLQPSHPEFGTDPGVPVGATTLVGIKRSGFIKLTWTK